MRQPILSGPNEANCYYIDKLVLNLKRSEFNITYHQIIKAVDGKY